MNYIDIYGHFGQCVSRSYLYTCLLEKKNVQKIKNIGLSRAEPPALAVPVMGSPGHEASCQ